MRPTTMARTATKAPRRPRLNPAEVHTPRPGPGPLRAADTPGRRRPVVGEEEAEVPQRVVVVRHHAPPSHIVRRIGIRPGRPSDPKRCHRVAPASTVGTA